MKHCIAFTLALFASLGASAQNHLEDSLALELEQALSALDSNVAAALPEQFTNALFRLISASLEEAAREMEQTAKALHVEVIPNEGSGGLTVVSGARGGEVESKENELIWVHDEDTLLLGEHEVNDVFDFNDVEEMKAPGNLGNWQGIGLGTVLLTTRPEATTLEDMSLMESPFDLQTGNALSSWNIQINPFEYRQPLIGDVFGITTGLGFDWWRFNVSPQTVISRNENGVLTLATDSDRQVRRNHLSLSYVRIPLLVSLRSRSNPEEALHLECGLVGGVRIHNQYVRKTSDSESKYVDKIKGFGMNPLQLNARLVLGFGGFSVFAEVPFRPLWSESFMGDNPLIYPVTLGVKFSEFD